MTREPRQPDFFIVGAPKCGTTAMHEYLGQHPGIFMPARKEPHFFGSDLVSEAFVRDPKRYAALFADASDETRIGEASVWYLYSRAAAEQIKAFCADAQIIIMLRNPVDMVYSLHSQGLYNGNEDIADFAEALAAEPDRKQGRRLPRGLIHRAGLYYSETVRYAEQVGRYLDVFGPEKVHVIIFDDFKRDTAAAFRHTLRFLGVDDDVQVAFDVVNPNKRVKSSLLRALLRRSPRWIKRLAPRRLRGALTRMNIRHEPRIAMDPALRRRLCDRFAAEVDKLGSLLGRDLSHWSDPGEERS